MWLIDLFRHNPNPTFRTHSMLGVGVLSAFLSVEVTKKLGLFSAMTFFWFVLCGVRVIWFDISPYHFNLDRFFLFSLGSVRSLFEGTLLTLSVCLMTKRNTESAILVFTALSVLNSILMLCNGSYGLLQVSSLDASLLVCTLPLFIRKEFKWKWFAILPVVAIIKSGSSTAALGFVLCAVLTFQTWKARIFAGLSIVLCIPFLPLSHSVLNSNGRSLIWSRAWTYFMERDVLWAGFGTGTYAIHERSFHPSQLWLWLHNDWLQIGFEQGLIGLSLAVILFGRALYDSRNTIWLTSSILCFGFCMMTQPILRNVIGGLYAALLIRIASTRKMEQN